MIMTWAYRQALRPVLFRAGEGDPELVHESTLAAVSTLGRFAVTRNLASAFCVGRQVPVTVAGLEFPSLVGLAAGMDKDGVGLRAWAPLGFGHVELGTVSATAQPGNPRPRVFRLGRSEALINRMGFPNAGAQALADRLGSAGVRRGNRVLGIPVGISLGKAKVTPLAAATEDYLASLRLLAPYADYLAVNVSSPNTPGLTDLQEPAALTELLTALVAEAGGVPIFVKVSPDLGEDALEDVLAVATATGVQGLIATNSSRARDGIDPADAWRAVEAGGLSGAPLAARSREVVAFLAARTELPVIGVGGILTAADGRAMLDAGARLLQVYTGFIYRGPGLVKQLSRLNAPTYSRSDPDAA